MLYSPLDTALLLVLLQPSGDGYFWLCSSKSSFRGTTCVIDAGAIVVANTNRSESICVSLFFTVVQHSPGRMGPLSSTPSTAGCSPSPEPVAVYAQSTLLLPDTQRRSYTIRVWSYETFIGFETVIGRYLAVKTWEGLDRLIIIMIYRRRQKLGIDNS